MTLWFYYQKWWSNIKASKTYIDPWVVHPLDVTEQAFVNEKTGYFEVTRWEGHGLRPVRLIDRITDPSAAFNRTMVLLTSEHLP